MNGTTIGLIAVAVVLIVDIVLLLGLVTMKAVNRRRAQSYKRRRASYVTTLSRRLALPGSTEPIGARATDDDAFLDAVIDLRNIVTGHEIVTLAGIVDGLGLARRQEARLRSRFPLGRRLRAAVSLAEIGDETTATVLIGHLSDREPEIRIQCARGLGRMQHTAAIDAILERLDLEEPWVRARFADTLIGFGAKATWPLVAYIRVNLRHRNNDGVVEAIRVLGVIGDRDVGPTLAGVLRVASDPEVRIATIEALGVVGGPLAIRPLKATFRSTDWRLRAKSATSLAQIGDPAVNSLLARGLQDANWWVRRNSAAGLASLQGGNDLLIEALGSDDPFARDAAAEALADCGVLAAARDREETGLATAEDRLLLSHMAGQVLA
ncbi:MAG TPA: HEAT repeat domain-containing protein [Acidimicrobiia bacterium]|jgi:HEAT repeat protein|nr:HEAT repeat domain-containing protein [Acidimicrobiia bacterium]